MKRCLVALCASCLLVCAVSAAWAGPGLQKVSDSLLMEYGKQNLEQMVRDLRMIRDAGLSYQPSLVVPLGGMTDCKDPGELQVLAGMYVFDANYALLYGKKKAFLETRRALNRVTLHGLRLWKKIEMQPAPAELIEAVARNPKDGAKRKELAKVFQANAEAVMAKGAKDPALLALSVDAAWGSVLEGLYVCCSMALDNPMGKAMVNLFNYHAMRLERFARVLKAYDGDVLDEVSRAMNMDARAEHRDRQALVDFALQAIRKNGGKLYREDVQAILERVDAARTPFAAPCH